MAVAYQGSERRHPIACWKGGNPIRVGELIGAIVYVKMRVLEGPPRRDSGVGYLEVE